MQPPFDQLGTQVLKHGYSKVVFLEVECKIDGTYRLGVSAERTVAIIGRAETWEITRGTTERLSASD